MSYIDSEEGKRYLVEKYRDENPLDTYYLSDEDIDYLIANTVSGHLFKLRMACEIVWVEIKKSFGFKNDSPST